MNINKQGKMIFQGELGDSSFLDPFMDFYHSLSERQEVPDLFKKVEASGDHRSLTLITALIIEHNLDRVLSSFLPNYKVLIERKDLTFSLKTDILKSLKLIPSHILKCSDVLRGIRNEFAHNLDIDNIDKISQPKKNNLKQIYKAIYGNVDKDLSLEKMFKSVSFLAICGIRSYEPNVKILREKIDDQDFINELYKNSQNKFDQAINKIKEEEPLETKVENGIIIKKYKDGLTEISKIL